MGSLHLGPTDFLASYDQAGRSIGPCCSETPSSRSTPKPQLWIVVTCCNMFLYIRSGKRLHNYGKSPCLVGKSTISWQFSIAMLNYQRVCHILGARVAGTGDRPMGNVISVITIGVNTVDLHGFTALKKKNRNPAI